jgi:aminoglycoside 3-N-acetyltransferase
MSSSSLSTVRAGVRAMLRKALSQERRTELKRIQGVARKKFAPVLNMVHGTFTTADLVAELTRGVPSDFEILMVHSSFDTFLPMYQGTAKDLVNALVEFCGRERTLVMPSFVMGGRTYDAAEYYRSRPFDVRVTPSEMGLTAEIFRRTPNVRRSLHPTCAVCALGPLATEVTAGHHLVDKGLGPASPFGVMTRRRTAILGLGVEYFRCLTHVHTAAHNMGDKFPIKFAGQTTRVALVDYDGSKYECTIELPDRSKKLDLRVLWSVLSKDELIEWRFHGVSMFVVPEARVVTERLTEAAGRGITVYGKVPVSVAASEVVQPSAEAETKLV